MQLQGFAAVIDALSLVPVTSFILCEVLDIDGSDFPASPDVAGHWISPLEAEAVRDLRRRLPGHTLPDFVAAAPVLRPPAGETVEEPVRLSGVRVPTSFHRPSVPPPASSRIPRGRSCRPALAPLLRCATPAPIAPGSPSRSGASCSPRCSMRCRWPRSSPPSTACSGARETGRCSACRGPSSRSWGTGRLRPSSSCGHTR